MSDRIQDSLPPILTFNVLIRSIKNDRQMYAPNPFLELENFKLKQSKFENLVFALNSKLKTLKTTRSLKFELILRNFTSGLEKKIKIYSFYLYPYQRSPCLKMTLKKSPDVGSRVRWIAIILWKLFAVISILIVLHLRWENGFFYNKNNTVLLLIHFLSFDLAWSFTFFNKLTFSLCSCSRIIY